MKRLEALVQLPEIKRLKYTLESSLPRIRIERLLMEVDRWCQFSNNSIRLATIRFSLPRKHDQVLSQFPGTVAIGPTVPPIKWSTAKM